MTDFRVSLAVRDGDDTVPAARLATILSAIDAGSSLNQAARSAGCSFRHAWDLIQRATRVAGHPVLETRTGGAGGGGSRLTSHGYELLATITDALERTAAVERSLAPSQHPPAKRVETLFVAATTELVCSGLMTRIGAAFQHETGIRVGTVAAGSTDALEIARSGRAEIALTHAPVLEQEFVHDGWAESAAPFLRGSFVIVGPADDPAGAGAAAEGGPTAALRAIAQTGAPFLSRGDNSGTHLRELVLWQRAQVEPTAPWYRPATGTTNEEILARAGTEGAYALVDSATVTRLGLSPQLVCITPREPAAATAGGTTRELIDVFSVVTMHRSVVGSHAFSRAQAFARWLRTSGTSGTTISELSAAFAPM